MEPFDLAGMIIAAIVAVPGHLIEAIKLNPEPWALVGLILVAVLVLKYVEVRTRGSRRRRAR